MAASHPINLKEEPAHGDGWMDRLRQRALSFGSNVDPINFFARLKDMHKLIETVGVAASAVASAGMINASDEAKKSKAFGIGVAVDVVNTAFQLGLSGYTTWWERQALVLTYEKLVSEELKLNRPVKFSDLKQSENDLVRNAAAYYDKKSTLRWLPDLAGLVRLVPVALGQVDKLTGGKTQLDNKYTGVLRDVPGIPAGLGAKTLFFSWYFASRQTGSHYELARIWNKTEGISKMPNRAVNSNVNPGELVTSEEITALYESVRKERGQREFTVDDPLTSRLFEQVARYLNHQYVPKLYAEKRPDLHVDGSLKDLQGTQLTHAKLITLFGSGGIDINDALATALRIEVISRLGTEAYKDVNNQLKRIQRPNENLPNSQFESELATYMGKIDALGKAALAEQWPPHYVQERLLPAVDAAYRGGEVPTRSDLIHQKGTETKTASLETEPEAETKHGASQMSHVQRQAQQSPRPQPRAASYAQHEEQQPQDAQLAR